jgi:uroporphyrin-III C-methyltransferase / precorrin-2 dehydrogenase / sirohydrochlorin ferrochelatase
MTHGSQQSDFGLADRRLPRRSAGRPRPIASLPVFMSLAGRRAVIAGGTQGAAWKAELLAATGARVEVFAEEMHDRLVELARDAENVQLVPRKWLADDLRGAAIFIGDAKDGNEASAMQAAANAAGVPVNVIDKPGWSDFNFGSIVDRSPLLVAISTSGGAPVFGQEIRSRIETLLPAGLRQWALAARSWRPAFSKLDMTQQQKRSLWSRFARHALDHPQEVPADTFRDTLIASALTDKSAAAGRVILAGAGPGDPELLTLKCVRALQAADVVLYDDLVSPEVLDMARREADKVSVGKRGFKPSCTQEDICTLMIELAQQGKRIVRLKGGDPMLFGRAGEEIAALTAAGIPVETIPGVTAASAAASRLGLSLTERDISRRVQFFTAHARGGELPDDLNWPALADPHATTIAYMGMRTLQVLSVKLISVGMPADTPAILAQHVTWQSEDYICGTIESLPQLAADRKARSPALVIIGKIGAGLNAASRLRGPGTLS